MHVTNIGMILLEHSLQVVKVKMPHEMLMSSQLFETFIDEHKVSILALIKSYCFIARCSLM